MARTPQTDESFLREVDDNLRQDRLATFARHWGPGIVTGVLVLLVLLAAGLWWRSHNAYQAGLKSEALAKPLDDLENNQPLSDPRPVRDMAANATGGYQAVARLAIAADAARRGDAKAAAADYAAIADDGALPQPIRDAAQVRAVALQYDAISPQAVIDKLKIIAVPGNAFFPSAGELTANAYLALGQKDRAGQLFAAIARDKSVPVTLRGRAAGMATSLGQTVDPVAGADGSL